MSKLLFDEQPLVIQPQFATLVGLNESIIIQQLHYWLQKSSNVREGHKWVYNTYKDWQEQFPFWSESTIRRTIGKLESEGLIISAKYNPLKIDNTKWYRLNYEKLEGMNRPSVQNEQTTCSEWTDHVPKLSRPLPENTTENTSDIKKDYCPKSKIYDEDSTYMKMANYLLEKIKEWKPDFIFRGSLQKWAEEFRRIHELDHRSKDDIRDVIDWVTQDSFWQSNILSPAKLRKQFDTLQAQMKNRKKVNRGDDYLNGGAQERNRQSRRDEFNDLSL